MRFVLPPQFPPLVEHLQEHGWEVDDSGAGLPPRRAEIRATQGDLVLVVDARLSVRSQAKLGLSPVWKSKAMSFYVCCGGTWYELRGSQALWDFAVHRDLDLADVKREALPFREFHSR